MSADPDTPPPLLDYRHPGTGPDRKIRWSHARYPLLFAVATAAIAIFSGPRSWGNLFAVLALPLIASWYVSVRVWRDTQWSPLWRTLLLAVSVCCVLLAAWAQTVDHGLPMYVEHWRVYGTVRKELYPLAAGIAVFALMRGTLWAYRYQCRRREPRNDDPPKPAPHRRSRPLSAQNCSGDPAEHNSSRVT